VSTIAPHIALHPVVTFVAATLIILLGIALSNAIWLPRLTKSNCIVRGSAPARSHTRTPVAQRVRQSVSTAVAAAWREDPIGTGALPPSPQPQLSILIPARNEAERITPCITGLLAQEGVAYEVLVLDDHSEDGTADVVRAAGCADSRLRVLCGQPLPPGWTGKNWACHQLALAARSDRLLFTDADVRWRPGALMALVAAWDEKEVDAITIWPTQQTITWSERLVVPLMAFAVLSYLPVWLVNGTNWPFTGAANGQCFAFRRQAYAAIGGHAAVRANVLDDVALAQRIKRARRWMCMFDAHGLITCRMYTSWRAVLHGYAKNILAGHGNSVLLLCLSMMFHGLVFVGPWLWLLVGWRWTPPAGWPVLPLTLALLGVGVRATTARATGQRPGDAWFMPLSVLLMMRIALQAIWWRWHDGGPQWKGRAIR